LIQNANLYISSKLEQHKEMHPQIYLSKNTVAGDKKEKS
jgi:hypothetical protein